MRKFSFAMSKIVLCSMVLIFCANSHAEIFRNWKKITIPGAFCGNGSPYDVFYDAQSSKKLTIELMGGGVCWSAMTCYGPTITAWAYPIPKFPIYGQFSLPLESASFVYDASYLYLPYCTGDVHAGAHIEEYSLGVKVHHTGYTNFLKSLEYLSQKKIISFAQFDDVILYGASAGAVGALAHAKNLDKYLQKDAKRTLIADSPGLHFGDQFWEKFRAPMIGDFSAAFYNMGITIDVRTGNLAAKIGNVCDHLSNWQIALMQGTRDVIMSAGFGGISPLEHEKLILSEQGLYRQSEGHQNCFAWIPKTYMHTFLLAPTASISIDGVNALQFAEMVYNRTVTRNYKN